MYSLFNKLVGSGSKAASPELLQELDQATKKAKNQKTQLKKLIDQVQERVDQLSGVSSSVDSIKERISLAEKNLETVDTRLSSSEKLSGELEQTEEKLQGIQAEVEEARNKIGEAVTLATEARVSSEALEEILKLSRKADDRLVSFGKKSEELIKVEKQVGVVHAQLDEYQDRLGSMQAEFKDSMGSVQKEYKEIHAAAGSLEKNTSTLRKGGGALKQDLDRAMEKARELEGKLSELASAEDRSKSLDKQLHTLNGMCEHVSQKAHALEAVEGTVERANAESARVNELLWNVDRQIKKLSDNKRVMDKSYGRLAQLNKMYDELDARVEDVKQEKKKFGSESLDLTKNMASALDSLRHELSRADSMRQQVELTDQKVQDLTTSVRDYDRQAKALAAKHNELAAAQRKAEQLEARLQSMQSLAQNVHEKVEGLGSLDERLDSLSKRSTEVSNEMDMLKARGSVVEEVDSRLTELLTRQDELRGKFSMLSEVRAEVDRANGVLATFRSESVDAEGRAKQLSERFQMLDGLSDRLDTAHQLSDALAGKSNDLEQRLEMVRTIETRVNALNELSQKIETRLREQGTQQASLASMQSTQESFGAQLKDHQKQLSSMHRSNRLAQLSKTAEALSGRLEAAERRLEEIGVEKQGLIDSQMKTAGIVEQIESALSRSATRVEQFETFDNQFKEAGELRKKWEKELLELDSRQKQIAIQGASAAAQLEKIGGLTKALERKEREFAAHRSKMGEFNEKFQSLQEMVDGLDRNIGQVNSRQNTVKRVARDVDGVFDVSERVNKEAKEIAEAHNDILETKELVAQLLGQTGQLEKKVSSVERKYGAIQEAESKLDGLSHLFRDIDVNIESFQKQKAYIEHIGEKLNQMDFAVKQAEAVTKILQEERDLAERIYETSRPKAADKAKAKLDKGVPVSRRGGVLPDPGVN